MKQVKQITIGNTLFTLQQDAFVELENYLDGLERYFSEDEGASDILEDIESATAEKLLASMDSNSSVSLEQVKKVMKEIGMPEDFDAAKNEEETKQDKNNSNFEKNSKKRRLYRNLDDKIIGGVSSGLADYFSIDPVVSRLIFVLLAIFTGFGFILYLILWVIVPPAKTQQEKFAMKGKEVTISKLKEEYKEISEKVSNRDTWMSIRGILERTFSVMGVVARGIISIARVVFGVVFSVAAAVLTGIMLIVSITWTTGSLAVGGGGTLSELAQIATSGITGLVTIVSGMSLAIVIVIILFVLGLSLLRKKFLFTSLNLIALISFGIISFIVLIYSIATSAVESRSYLLEEGILIEEVSDDGYRFIIEDDQVRDLHDILLKDGHDPEFSDEEVSIDIDGNKIEININK